MLFEKYINKERKKKKMPLLALICRGLKAVVWLDVGGYRGAVAVNRPVNLRPCRMSP